MARRRRVETSRVATISASAMRASASALKAGTRTLDPLNSFTHSDRRRTSPTKTHQLPHGPVETERKRQDAENGARHHGKGDERDGERVAEEAERVQGVEVVAAERRGRHRGHERR